MKMARVIGTVVASVQHAAYDGQTILLVEPVDAQRVGVGPAFIAVDRAQAGVGDFVMINSEGNGARQMFGIDPKGKLPIIDVIVAIIDHAEEQPWQ
jgi:microcompartment protein CcmK/EutM